MEAPHYSLRRSKRSIVTKDEALEILEQVKENINTCCAITMEPDEVLILCDKLEKYIKNVHL
jgi:hypothetical protein